MNATERRAAVTRIVSAQVEVEREHSTETVEVFGNVLMPASPNDEMAVRVTSVVSHFSGRSQADDWTPKVQEQFEAALIDEACAKGSWVARVHRRNGADPCTPECGANANLIASAPELLQMLEDMVEAHDSTDGKIVGIESARALIRKVRGGA